MKISEILFEDFKPVKAIGNAKPGSGAGLQVHTPVPKAFKEMIRRKVFERYARIAVAKAREIKGEPLTTLETETVIQKLAENLEKRDFFYVG